MGNKSVTARANKNEVTVQQHETDSPIIPAAQLEQLHQFRPDLVNWVIDQTTIEAENRRVRQSRIDRYIFTERLLGQIFALVIGVGGSAIGAYVALNGQPWAGVGIATAAISSLAVAFVLGRQKKD